MKYSKLRSWQKIFFRQKCFEDRIKHTFSYKDSVTGTYPAWHMRLTLRKATFMDAIRKDLPHRMAAFITGVVLLFWVYLLLERIYFRLAYKPNFAIAWLLPPGPVQVFFVLALPLLAMLVVLAVFYHYNIGTKLGAKLTIKVLPVMY